MTYIVMADGVTAYMVMVQRCTLGIELPDNVEVRVELLPQPLVLHRQAHQPFLLGRRQRGGGARASLRFGDGALELVHLLVRVIGWWEVGS